MPIKIAIIAEIEPLLADLLQRDPRFEVAIRTAGPLEQRIGDAEIAVARTMNRITRAVLESVPRLRVLAQGTSGIDNIDLDTARERGVEILSLPGVNANAVAELVIGLIISMTRTVPLYTREVASGIWRRDDCTTRHELPHYSLGIVGHGNVGSRLSRLATAFGMRPRAYDPYITDFGAAGRVDSLEELLATSDIVTLHVPLTNETRRMIAERQLQTMRRGSFLISTARGEVLDLEAALAALASGHLGGLAVDVFDPEPPRRTFPDDPRLILTPHIGGGTFEAKHDAVELLYRKIVEWVEEKRN